LLQLALFGPYWWVFWILQVGLGTVLPVLLLVLRPEDPWAVGWAGLLPHAECPVPLRLFRHARQGCPPSEDCFPLLRYCPVPALFRSLSQWTSTQRWISATASSSVSRCRNRPWASKKARTGTGSRGR